MDDWDQVSQCSIRIQTGHIIIAGCTDYFHDAKRIPVSLSTYQALVCYKGLNTISVDGLVGDDTYQIYLFPGDEIDVVTLKKRDHNVPTFEEYRRCVFEEYDMLLSRHSFVEHPLPEHEFINKYQVRIANVTTLLIIEGINYGT